MFSKACVKNSVHRGEVYTPRADTLLMGIHPLPDRHLPPSDGHCSGRYTSYWNAFLFYFEKQLTFFQQVQYLLESEPNCYMSTNKELLSLQWENRILSGVTCTGGCTHLYRVPCNTRRCHSDTLCRRCLVCKGPASQCCL